MAQEFSVIGKPEHHDKEIVDIVTGRLDFSGDNLLGKKLFARTLQSPYAHAKIKSIGTSQALALPGVEAVCTYEDCPIWSDTICYCGQEVAAVAAVDEATAARALTLIDVDYEQLPFVLDPDEAMKPGAPLVGVLPEKNTQEWELMRGDYSAGFAKADVIFEGTVGWTNYFQHGNIESVIGVAYWTGDHLYVWTTAQNPFAHMRSISSALNMPHNKIHLISHGTGSGHGDKHSCEPAIVAAVLAKKAGKPVQNSLSRAENFVMRAHQFPLKATIKIGAKSDGTITAIDSYYLGDAAATTSNRASSGNDSIRYTYRCPDARFLSTNTATNKPRSGAWRCVAHPQCTYITEIVIERLAEKLGMNPLDFRLKNIISPGEIDQDSGRPTASNGIKECLEGVANAIGWSAKWHAPGTETLTDGRKHGIGISGHVDGHGSMSSVVGAIVNLRQDGTALISPGMSRAGGGATTACCHIAAETLGMNYEDVNTGDWGNTDVCSDGGSEGGSTRVITLGAAFQMAAEDARAQLFETAAKLLEVSAAELDAKEGKIFVKADPSKFKTHKEVAGKNSYSIVGRGYTWDKVLRHREVAGKAIGSACEVRGVSATAAEVAVDTETGEVEVLAFANACDMGRAIFRKGSLNQINGGSEISVGEALMYEQILDQGTGITINASFLDHKWPTTLDLNTDKHQAVIVEADDACGPYGAKGLGEPPVSNYGSIANAVYNATGVWIEEPPITPQKILKALGKA